MRPVDSLQSAILRARPNRSLVDPWRTVAWFEESEATGRGGLASVLTLILTASECPWKCAMCDLWKHTLPLPTPLSAIPNQIKGVLDQCSSKDHDWIKLYNSGSFFDRKSIPIADHKSIAEQTSRYARVIVENHPRLCGPQVADFQQLLGTQLEVALGVESVQPGLLRRLNKGMDRSDVDRAIRFLHSEGIATRAFLLVRPPWNLETEALRWTQLSIKYLCYQGVRHISLIPVRTGNGWLDRLERQGEFAPPLVSTVERLLDWSLEEVKRIGTMATVVTVDLWDWHPPNVCPLCIAQRIERMESMNLTQEQLPQILCDCHT